MLRVLALSAACVLGTVSVADAEWHFTPMLGVTFRANTGLLDPNRATEKPHTNIGGAVALLGEGLVGVEGIAVYTPSLFGSDGSGSAVVESSRAFVLMGNVVVAAPRRWTEYSLRPFVSSGVGLMTAHGNDPGLKLFAPDFNVLGFNVGGGAIGFLTKRTGVRFDLRYFSNLHSINASTPRPSAIPHLRYLTFSVGVVIRKF